jgi:serine/threonine protein kinase
MVVRRRDRKGGFMPGPETTAEFLDLLRKSEVVEPKALDAQLRKLLEQGPLPDNPTALAERLVTAAVLTRFQAEHLLQGKWRRFIIGKYRILERLGAGGMASVYLCEHRRMRRRVAVKVLPASKANDPAALERFYREARAVAALDHPNIVRAYDIDQAGELHFLIMEYVEGATLQQMVDEQGPLDIGMAALYIRQTALGLEHVHQRAGLVHRDIKPGNILVDRKGIVKILDMGLARFFRVESDALSELHHEKVLGTIDYLAPELIVDGSNVDIRADIYSLGATLYFCLTGKPPFELGTPAQKMIWHQVRQPKPVRELRPQVPEEMARVLATMTAKDPVRRYHTPADVADALTPWCPESKVPTEDSN